MEPAHFQQSYGMLPEPMLLVTIEGEVVAANAAAAELLGHKQELLHGLALERLAGDPKEKVGRFLALCRRSSQFVPGALTIKRADGETVACRAEGAALRGKIGVVPTHILLRLLLKETTTTRFVSLNERIDALNREIMERQRVEAQLHAQREWLRTTLESIGDAVIATDEFGRIVLINRVAQALTGWSQAEAEGEPLDRVFSIFHEETREVVENPVSKVLREGRIVGLANHTVLVSLHGKESPIDDSGAPIRDREGRTIGVVLVFRDVTERARSDRALRETNRTLERTAESLRQFAYAAAHDLQEPVRNVALYTQLLAQRYEGKLGAEADQFIKGAIEGAHRIQNLIQDLLSYTRVTEEQEDGRAECEAREVFQAVLEHLRTAIEMPQAQVSYGVLPRVAVYGTHLTQILQNLISNALKYRSSEPPRIHVSAERQSNQWVFSVRDNGIGIPAEHHESIFKVFKRLHGREIPGTGIGLAICERIVSHYGGSISVYSERGQGACFTFTVPAITQAGGRVASDQEHTA